MSDSIPGADAGHSDDDDRETHVETDSNDDGKIDESGLPVSENAPHLEPEIAAKAKGLP